MMLSHSMAYLLQQIVTAGDDGLLVFSGRTTDALKRRELVRCTHVETRERRLPGEFLFFATDKGKAAL